MSLETSHILLQVLEKPYNMNQSKSQTATCFKKASPNTYINSQQKRHFVKQDPLQTSHLPIFQLLGAKQLLCSNLEYWLKLPFLSPAI